MSVGDVVYAAYERRLARSLDRDSLPRHVGVMLDGNRQWAKPARQGQQDRAPGGADNIAGFLGWCEDLGVEVVTLWFAVDGQPLPPGRELAPLLQIIETAVADLAEWALADQSRRRARPPPDGTATGLP